ncbi:hypothetical protein LZC95_39730 [Pendulispora brunnea]|uniref:TonB C-terminal domain-containing protein n=1 Tax=Pendulispora brunnea TaxID=2905690 RepID=A0ABZ2K1F7_9BACT
MLLGCAGEAGKAPASAGNPGSSTQVVPPPRAWTIADYGDEYRSTGWVRPKRLSGTEPSFFQDGKSCAASNVEVAAVIIRCQLGLDGIVSKCHSDVAVPGCEVATSEALRTIESTYRIRPPIYNGQIMAVPYSFTFRIRADAPNPAPLH